LVGPRASGWRKGEVGERTTGREKGLEEPVLNVRVRPVGETGEEGKNGGGKKFPKEGDYYPTWDQRRKKSLRMAKAPRGGLEIGEKSGVAGKGGVSVFVSKV